MTNKSVDTIIVNLSTTPYKVEITDMCSKEEVERIGNIGVWDGDRFYPKHIIQSIEFKKGIDPFEEMDFFEER